MNPILLQVAQELIVKIAVSALKEYISDQQSEQPTSVFDVEKRGMERYFDYED